MSMTRDRGEVIFECDYCGEILETGHKNFDNAREYMREEAGWNIMNRVGQWLHFDTLSCRKTYERNLNR